MMNHLTFGNLSICFFLFVPFVFFVDQLFFYGTILQTWRYGAFANLGRAA
jgi:hypothetical protein